MTLKHQYPTTKIQDKIIEYWSEYQKKNGHSPTMEQAKKDLGYAAPSSIQRHLEALEKKGLMSRVFHRYWYVKI